MANTSTGNEPGSRPRRSIIARLRGQPQPIEIKLKVKSDVEVELRPNSPNSTSTTPQGGRAGPGGQPGGAGSSPLDTSTHPNNGLGRQPNQSPDNSAPSDQPGDTGAQGQPATDKAAEPEPNSDSPNQSADTDQPAGGAPAASPYDEPGNAPAEPHGKEGEPRSAPDEARPNDKTAPEGGENPSSQKSGASQSSEPDFYNPDSDTATNAGSDLADREAMADEAPDAAEDTPAMNLAARENVYDRPGNEPGPPVDQSKSKDDSSKEQSSDKQPGQDEPGSDEEINRKRPEDEDRLGNGYRPSKKPALNGVKALLEKRLVISLLSVACIAGLIFFGSFFSAFKLSGIMENVSARTFARLQGVEDRRSQAWMRAYLQIRLMDIGDHPDLSAGKDENLLFRANRVNNGYNINTLAMDWYRTLRTSSFEQDVFEKQGIKFTSFVDGNGRPRPGIIKLNGGSITLGPLSQETLDGIAKNDPKALNLLNDRLTKFDNDKEARRAIRKVVWDNTQDWQVFKRRHVRKDIQNMTGVRDWRFFEGTRDKVSDKTLDIRNKIIAKSIPNSTKTGKFVHCLFGISDCKDLKGDPAFSDNQDAAALSGNDQVLPGDTVDQRDPKTGNITKVPVDPNEAAKAVKKITSDILQKVTPVVDAVNWVSTLDSLDRINTAVKNGSLAKTVAVARGVQAMGLFQVYQTAADQTKSGDVNTQELNAFMGTIDTGASSEGWSAVVSGNGNGQPLTSAATASAATTDQLSPSDKAAAYCSPESQAALSKDPSLAQKEPLKYGYAYQCPGQRIGGNSTAKQLQDAYNQTFGQVLTPVLKAYDGIRHAPLIGAIADIATSLFNGASQAVIAHTVQPILKALGLTDQIDKLMSYVTTKVVAFLGAGPILTGNEPAGVFMNWIIQGGAYTAETTARTLGGSLTTKSSMIQTQIAMAGFQQTQAANSSLKERLFDSSNPHSLSAKTSVALASFSLSKLPAQMFNFSWLGNIFGFAFHPAGADAINGYAASNFAGIQTYDYPEQCYADPLTMTPQTSTNIQVVLPGQVPDSDLTWDLMTSSDKWYAYVYSKTQDDNLAQTIYNCALLDTSIRGSIGYLYGYSNDDGLDDTTGNVVTSDTGQAASSNIDTSSLTQDSTSVPCAAGARDIGTQDGYTEGKPIKIKLCALPNILSSSDESSGRYGITGANGQAIVNSRVSGAFYNMAEAAKKDGITLQATSSFRTMSHQTCLYYKTCGTNEAAKPGFSNHQMGMAIDFATDNGQTAISKGDKWFGWLSTNAPKFGIKNYPAENWHWSPTGN